MPVRDGVLGRLQVPTVVRRVGLLLAIGLSFIALGHRLAANGSQPAAAAGAVEVAECSTLPAPPVSSAWELKSELDRERGTISIEIFGSYDWAATVSYTDPTCLADEVLGPIIAEHLEDARVDQMAQCAEFARQLASGRVMLRGQEANIERVQAYMDRWC